MEKSKKVYNLFCVLLLSVFIQTSCTTEDILPAASIEADSVNLSEDNGSVTLSINLNVAASSNLSFPISFSGSASSDIDYSTSSNTISISAGSKSGSLTISSKQDQEIEGEETIIVSLNDNSDFLVFGQVTLLLIDDDSDSDEDGVLDTDDSCPNTPGEIDNNGCPWLGFLINEVLYDPASGSAGDANGDGTRDANGDEFIEFFNSGSELDISGYTISDASQLRHTFPAGTIIPKNGVLLVFGGGNPTGDFGGAIVQTASEGQINMSNSGDLVTIKDASGTTILTFDVEPLSNNPDESYTRNPDLTGEFVQHDSVAEANGALFSPGTKVDGSSF